MSWSLYLAGRPAAVTAALDAESQRLTGQSKTEFDAVLPGLKALVAANYDTQDGHDQPLVTLEANGHAHGTPEKGYGSCAAKIGVLANRFVGCLLLALGCALSAAQVCAAQPTDDGLTVIDDLAHAVGLPHVARKPALSPPSCGPAGCPVPTVANYAGGGCASCGPQAPVYRGGGRFRPLRRVFRSCRGCR